MLKAILQNGAIVPLEPLPPEWKDGTALEVAEAGNGAFDVDAWATLINRLCSDSATEEEERMQSVIDEHRRLAKLQVRREMGVSE